MYSRIRCACSCLLKLAVQGPSMANIQVVVEVVEHKMNYGYTCPSVFTWPLFEMIPAWFQQYGSLGYTSTIVVREVRTRDRHQVGGSAYDCASLGTHNHYKCFLSRCP